MGISSWLLRQEKRFAWSLFGAAIGIASLAIAYVASRDEEASVAYEVSGDASVFEVHTSVSELAIFFRNEDITRTGRRLRVLTIRLINDGGVDILQGHYDQREPWGFVVKPAEIIEARLVSASSESLERSIRPTVSTDSVALDKVILEKGEQATFQVLVLHSQSASPRILPFGKIAGIDHIQVRVEQTASGAPSFWTRVTSGSVSIQAARSLLYTVAFFVAVLAVGMVIAAGAGLVVRYRRNRRRQQIAPIQAVHQASDSDISGFAQMYIEGGPKRLLAAHHLLSNPDVLRRELRRLRYMDSRTRHHHHLPDEQLPMLAYEDSQLEYTDITIMPPPERFSSVALELRKHGLVDTAAANSAESGRQLEMLEDLMDQLRIEKPIESTPKLE